MELEHRRLGDFELRERLAQGGMGVVYRAVQLNLGREVVVKVLRSPELAGAGGGERFVREAQLASRLEHPYAAHVYAFGSEDDGLLWIAMEHVRGTTLGAFLTSYGPWSLERLVPFFERICETVQTAHEQGIVHRDLKPSNIMVIARAGQLLPKLLDFGIAKWVQRKTTGPINIPAAFEDTGLAAGSDDGQPLEREMQLTPSGGRPLLYDSDMTTLPGITGPGSVIGSPYYMAPEQWNDPAAAGEPADQYALGVILYETLTGVVPFTASKLSELARLHREAEPPSMPSVPAPVERVVRRALAKRPEQRFASVLELAAALRVATVHRSAGSVPPPVGAVLTAADANPYRGLLAFEAEHQALFFGRDADTREVIVRVWRDPLLLVAGDSGVGKSSLCRAGVLPRVTQGALGGGRQWQIVSLRPGRRPATSLVAALAPFAEGDTLDAVLARVGERVRLRPGEEASGLFLFVDQLEEVITIAEDAEAERFIHALLALSALPGGVRVLAAARGDFATRVLARFDAGEEVARTLFVLGPLDDGGVRAAITRPALAAGVRFESDAMVDALAEQATRLDGALPLLQFALAELWELREPARGVIPEAALEKVGGIAGIVARHADGVLARMRPAARAAARQLILRLVTAERTRARLRAEDLIPPASRGDAREALEALIQGRLVVARDDEEGGAAYELAHEVLIGSWGTLGGWLDADTERHAAEERVRAAAAEWERIGRARDGLWGAAQLADAAALDEDRLDAVSVAFLRASRHALRRRRLAWRIGLVTAFALLAVVAAALTYLNREATRQNEQARRHIVRLYTEQGRRAVLDGHRQRALVYLAEAWRRGGRDPGLRFLLQRAGTALDQQVAVLRGHSGFVRDARFSPDGRTIATIGDDRTARLWDAATGRERHVLRGHTDWVRAVAFASDGRELVTVSWDGTARLWTVATGAPRWTVDLREGRPRDGDLHDTPRFMSAPCVADFTGDGARLLVACIDPRALVLDRATGAVIARLEGGPGLVTQGTFAPDGAHVVTGDTEAVARLFDAVTGTQVATLSGHEGSVRTAAFSPDGGRVLTVGREGTARLWSSQDGAAIAVLHGHQGPAAGAFTADGARVVTRGVDRTVRIWDARDGHAITVVQRHEGPVTAIDVSPDGAYLFSADETGVGELSDPAGRRVAVLEGHLAMIWTGRFSPDATRVVTASQDGTARVWRVIGDQIRSVRDHRGPVVAVRFSPDGRVLWSAAQDGELRRWDLGGTGPRSAVFARADKPLLAIAVSPDGRLVAAAGIGGATRVWEVAGGRLLGTFETPAGADVNGLAFAADGVELAVTSADGDVRIWNTRAGGMRADLRAHGGESCHPVGFDAKGRWLATGGDDGAVRLFDARTGKAGPALEHGAPIGYLSFCDERLVVAAGSSVRTWRSDGTAAGMLMARGEAILAPACPGGRIILGGGRAVGIFDLVDGSQLENVEIEGFDIMSVDAAADGTIAAGQADAAITWIRLALDQRPPEEQVQLTKTRVPLDFGEGGEIHLRR